MTELLPILFARGQNEGVDPRVAPADVHRVAGNVRWRKDGRPAKRYGTSPIATSGFDSGGAPYTTQPCNAVTQWNDTGLLAIGSAVRQRAPAFIGGWSVQPTATSTELSHWGPGERSTVISTDLYILQNLSVGQCNGVLLYAWDDGTGNIYYSARSVAGALLLPPTVIPGTGNAFAPRCVSCSSFIHFLWRDTAVGTVYVSTFSPTTFALTGPVSLGLLAATTDYIDGFGRGSDFVVAFRSSSTTITAKLVTSGATPAVTQTRTQTMVSAGFAKVAISGTSTSDVMLAWCELNTGKILFGAFNNAMTATTLATTLIETDANNIDQPGIVAFDNTHADITWGGFDFLTETSYMRYARAITSTGATSGISTAYGVRSASKPFYGPAFAALGAIDGLYSWVHTHNSSSSYSGTKWDDQRTYYLFSLTEAGTKPPRRHLHTPGLVASAFATTSHLSDVCNAGLGNGYFTALANVTRVGSYLNGEAFAAESIGFRSIFESQRQAARDTATAGRATQFAGGSLFEFNAAAEETGFTNFPVIQSVTGGVGGGLTASANYLYRAVYEWIDSQGRRHRSAASDPFALATGASTSATVSIKPLAAETRLVRSSGTQSASVVHVYRTLAGQGTYHRVTPNTGAPAATPGVATVSFVDTMSDASALRNEILYTDGGVLDNTLPPPSTFMCVCNGRLWLGGQLDRNVITASKVLVDGEPTQFTDSAEFSVFLPSKCTGLASIDGTVVAFGRERIYFVSGDGPNDQGVGSFNPPTELPTDVGCIDWRSIIECSMGIFFQSKRGIFLLPRGFNTPIFIGAEVESTLASFPIVVSATLVSVPSSSVNSLGEITARFVVAADEAGSSTRILVYDLRTGGWSVDSDLSGSPHGVCGTWSDTFVVSKTSGGVYSALFLESPGSYADNGSTFIPTTLGTADIRPFGVAGFGGFDRVVLMGEYRGNANVTIAVSVDGATADNYVFDVTGVDAGVTDGTVYLDVTPKTRMGSAIRVTVSDAQDVAFSPTEGFIMQALFIEHETIGKTKRLAAARKA